MSDIDWNVKHLLDPRPEGEGTGPAFVCECGQRTRVASMQTPLREVVCVNCGRAAITVPRGEWDFS